MPTSVGILDSKEGYPDTALVEGVWVQASGCEDRASVYDTNNSRSDVVIGQLKGRSQECVHVAPDVTREFVYRNKNCIAGTHVSSDEYQTQKPTEFQPRCLVILFEAASRKVLLDSLISQGRDPANPLRIEVNFTTTLASNPDFGVASMNCGLGQIVAENYRRDRVGQEVQDRIVALRSRIRLQGTRITLFERTVRGLSAYRPPGAPPPPSTPPRPDAPPGLSLPPTPPVAFTFAARLAQLNAEKARLESQLSALLATTSTKCVPSATKTCGRTSVAAPNPWVAEGGAHCAGYETHEALEGSFCAHWSSINNVDAAETSGETEQLLSVAKPWCYAASDGKQIPCSPVANRVVRAGAYELDEFLRLDRYYCASQLFRELVLEDGSVSEATCRSNLTTRAQQCRVDVCEPCHSQCNYPVARTIASVVKCVNPTNRMAFIYCLQVSDAGQLARASHGAVRKDNYIAVRFCFPPFHLSATARRSHVCTGTREARSARVSHLPQQPTRLRAARQYVFFSPATHHCSPPSLVFFCPVPRRYQLSPRAS